MPGVDIRFGLVGSSTTVGSGSTGQESNFEDFEIRSFYRASLG